MQSRTMQSRTMQICTMESCATQSRAARNASREARPRKRNEGPDNRALLGCSDDSTHHL